MNNKNLIIPVYLNQKIVFDFVAIIEDGIAQMQTIQRTEKYFSDFQSEIGGEIGTSNILSFLKINLKSSLSGEKNSKKEKGVTEEKVHTPTSLFSKLLEYLYKNNLVSEIKNEEDLNKDIIGHIVHYSGTLDKNPINSFSDTFEKLINMINVFIPNNQTTGKKVSNNNDPNKIIFDQINSFIKILKSENIVDIICKIKDSNIETVLQTNIDYFINKNMNDLIDGSFNIIGKVIKTTKKANNEKFNLLRNTNLSSINNTLVETLFSQFNSQELQKSGITFPKLKTEIYENSMLIIPIAIYV